MQQEIANLIKPADVKNHIQDYFISAIESGDFSAPTNILDSETYGTDLNEYIATILDHLATSVGSTFGPAGLNTIIHKSDMSHSFSKDGYSVLREIMYNEPVANTVKELVKNVSRKMTLTVGDGSTTVVLVTSAVYAALNELNYPRAELIRVVDAVSKGIFAAVDKEKANTDSNLVLHPSKLTSDHFYNIAMVSTNGDEEISNLIAKAYSEYGNDITFSYSTLNDKESSMKQRNALTIDRGMINPLMANKPSESYMIAEYDKPRILLINGKIESVEVAQGVANIINMHFDQEHIIPLVIVANHYSQQVNLMFQELILNNKKQNIHLPLLAIDHASISKYAVEKFGDLAAFTNAHLINLEAGEQIPVADLKYYNEQIFGMCDKVIAKNSETQFIGRAGDYGTIQIRIDGIKQGIKELACIEDQYERSARINELDSRINNLSSSVIDLYIGGRTPQEIKMRGYLVDDCVRACKSAAKNGIVRGSQLFIPSIIFKYADDIVSTCANVSPFVDSWKVINAFKNAFRTVYVQLFKNLITDNVCNIYSKRLSIILETLEANEESDIESKIRSIMYELASGGENGLYLTTVLDARTLLLTSNKDMHVSNSLETELQVIDNAFTLAKQLLSSNQFVCGY